MPFLSNFVASIALHWPNAGVEAGWGYVFCTSSCLATQAPGCVATGGALAPGVIAACASICAPWAAAVCFADDVTITKIVNASHCFSADVSALGGSCLEPMPVQAIQVDDAVLTRDDSGQYHRTTVIANQRHVGAVEHVNVTVGIGNGMRNLVVTRDHVLLLYPQQLVLAKDLAVGDVVEVDHAIGLHGVVQEVGLVVLDHKNELVTEVGTVLANDIHVTTMCLHSVDGVDPAQVEALTQSWRTSHQFLQSVGL